MRIEFFLSKECSGVEALQLFAILIAFPVRSGERHQLKRADRFRRRDVRPATQIEKLALLIKGQRFVFGKSFSHVFDFERLFHVLADLNRGVAFFNDSFEGFIEFDEFLHLLFDRREIFFGQRRVALDVVVETVFERGPERELHVVFDSHHRAGHHVRTAVPQRRKSRLGPCW